MNDFVEQCRREWKRLRVPGPVAAEMAADLAADLKEAAAEGASAEEVLGSAAADPRSFAASWAAERAVIPPPRWTARLRRGWLLLAAIATLTVITAIGAALVIFASPHASPPTATIRVASPRTPVGVVWVEQSGRVVVAPASRPRVEINKAGSILLIVGIAGVMSSVLYLLWTSKLPSLSAT